MHVIYQMISLLRHKLTPEQHQYLLENGFTRYTEREKSSESIDDEEHSFDEDGRFLDDSLELSLLQKCGSRRKYGTKAKHGKKGRAKSINNASPKSKSHVKKLTQTYDEISLDTISWHLSKAFERWDEPLSALMILARHVGGCSSWREATKALEKCSDNELLLCVQTSMRAQSFSKQNLWNLLSFNAHIPFLFDPESAFTVFPTHDFQGHVWNAYTNAFLNRNAVSSGSKSFIFQKMEVVQVLRFTKLLQRLQGTLLRCFQVDPTALARSLRKSKQHELLHTFILVHNMYRALFESASVLGSRCSISEKEALAFHIDNVGFHEQKFYSHLSFQTHKKAWKLGLKMAVEAQIPFLFSYCQNVQEKSGILSDVGFFKSDLKWGTYFAIEDFPAPCDFWLPCPKRWT